MDRKEIAILGSTGSIGTQALDVIRAFPNRFRATVLTAHSRYEVLIQQALEFKPHAVLILKEQWYETVRQALAPHGIAVYAGKDALEEIVQIKEIDIVLNAIVGSAGLRPTVKAIEKGKDIALANKETLVVAGELVMELARAHQVRVLPVDSEHSAIFQCLVGEEGNTIDKIYLTASGGPFRGMGREELVDVTKEEAMRHPNWEMGAKITIDSASLMNKGLEVIEAKWLFDLQIGQIDVIVHPQSIIHSIVQFEDGSMKAQLGLPDMKLPIQYALTYPQRLENSFSRFNFMDYPELTFEKADFKTFRNLELAYEALRVGGNRPCVLNAANEIAVEAFLRDEIGFLQMSDVIEETLCHINVAHQLSLADYLATDEESRRVARKLIKA